MPILQSDDRIVTWQTTFLEFERERPFRAKRTTSLSTKLTICRGRGNQIDVDQFSQIDVGRECPDTEYYPRCDGSGSIHEGRVGRAEKTERPATFGERSRRDLHWHRSWRFPLTPAI